MEITEKVDFYKSLFYRGWRPMIGWVLTAGLLISFVAIPITTLLYAIITGETLDIVIDTGNLLTLVIAALGHIGVRTYEKGKNVNNT